MPVELLLEPSRVDGEFRLAFKALETMSLACTLKSRDIEPLPIFSALELDESLFNADDVNRAYERLVLPHFSAVHWNLVPNQSKCLCEVQIKSKLGIFSQSLDFNCYEAFVRAKWEPSNSILVFPACCELLLVFFTFISDPHISAVHFTLVSKAISAISSWRPWDDDKVISLRTY